ncbi:glycosyl transferase [Bombardia bombarda]|uniref:Glycosyl transferase n=1 Tax=Bombardia bombarda TaxID=252184 RepID=A0AA39XNH1_9PEZI|nr:glycosyl transferase [Bombardia bombarda]
MSSQQLAPVDIKPLLSRLWPLGHPKPVTADEIAEAISYFFTNQVSDVQASSLLMCLHFTGLDRHADVLAKTAAAMLKASAQIDKTALRSVVEQRGRKEGNYNGGLCDIVGTGGDAHNTFNISTTSSILASSLLLLSKHGNKASTSKSGSADLLANMANPLPRKSPAQLPWRTVFNLVGPLANPTDLEARMIGVARKDIGPVFADALRIAGAKKAMVVCGDEELDEISCAGDTLCWMLSSSSKEEEGKGSGSNEEIEVEHFLLHPRDFGLPAHPLSTVSPGKEPAENAAILARILNGQVPDDDPILHFVLINTAALFVVSGICEAETSDMGHGDDGVVIQERGPGGGRWREGVRRARWAIKSGEAARQWAGFVEVTNSFSE